MAIARALAQEATVILADEPVASLDPESAAAVLDTLHRVAKAGVAVVASLHQVHLAMSYADRIIALRDGPRRRRRAGREHRRAGRRADLREDRRAGGERAPVTESSMRADEEWDAGDLGCGELVLELKQRLDACSRIRSSGSSRSIPARRPTCPRGAG